jgi:hypothetical protein
MRPDARFICDGEFDMQTCPHEFINGVCRKCTGTERKGGNMKPRGYATPTESQVLDFLADVQQFARKYLDECEDTNSLTFKNLLSDLDVRAVNLYESLPARGQK